MDPNPEHVDEAELRERTFALLPSWRERDVGDFEFLPGGYANHNFRFRCDREHYVLRLPLAEHSHLDRELEAAVQQQVVRNGIATVEVIAFDVSTGSMISRWLEGPLLIEQPPAPQAVVRFVGSLQHKLPASSRSYDPIALSRRFLSVGKPDPQIRLLAEQLTWQPEHTSPCHNDLNPWNIIVHPQHGWTTLDWEWFGTNDPLFDLVTLHQGLGLDDAGLPALARELAADTAVEERLRLCLLAFWLREYAWAHAELIRGNPRAEIRAQLDTAAARLRAR